MDAQGVSVAAGAVAPHHKLTAALLGTLNPLGCEARA